MVTHRKPGVIFKIPVSQLSSETSGEEIKTFFKRTSNVENIFMMENLYV